MTPEEIREAFAASIAQADQLKAAATDPDSGLTPALRACAIAVLDLCLVLRHHGQEWPAIAGCVAGMVAQCQDSLQ